MTNLVQAQGHHKKYHRLVVRGLLALCFFGLLLHFATIETYLTKLRLRSQLRVRSYLAGVNTILNVPSPNYDRCRLSGSVPIGNKTILYDKNILTIKTPNYFANYKNPCFYGNVTVRRGSRYLQRLTIRCVPYFFLIGAPKAGTTDIWQKLVSHPDVQTPMDKELMWFNLKRFGLGYMVKRREWSFFDYQSCFSRAARAIQTNTTRITDTDSRRTVYHPLVTGEASADTLFDNDMWMQLPGNEGCSEPYVTTATLIRHLIPRVKLVVSLRNPTDRAFSDYVYEARYLKYNRSVVDFHKSVVSAIRNHTECRRHFSSRGCAYNKSLEQDFKARLRIGMYSIFLDDWLSVFPLDQMFIIRFEDHVIDSPRTYRQLYRFLDLRPLPREVMDAIFSVQIPNTRREEENIGKMRDETRYLLDTFYAPYNARLAELLGDTRYLWVT